MPLLEDTLALARLESLRQRIAVHARLEPFDQEQTRGYMLHRLEVAGANPKCLPEDASAAIHEAARGIAREINTLATEALQQASGAGANAITPEHVTAAVAERRARAIMSGTPALRSSERQTEPTRRVAAAETKTAQAEPGSQPARTEHKAEPAEPTSRPARNMEQEPASRAVPAEPKARPAAAAKAGAQKPGKGGKEPSGKQARAETQPSRREQPAPSEPAERTAKDPEVQDWVSRFKSDGPIQIGSRSGAAMQPLTEFEESLADEDLEAKLAAPEVSPGPRPPAAKRPKSGMVTKPRSGRRRRGWNDPSRLSIAAALVLFGTVAMILIGRSRQADRPNQPPSRTAALTPAKPKPAKVTDEAEKPGKKPRSEAHSSPSRSSDTERERRRTSTTTHEKTTREVAGTSTPVFAPTPRLDLDSAGMPARRYALEVATYINETRAREEMDRLSVLTSLPTRLRSAPDFSGTTYRILVGRFEQRAQAERAAEDLVGRGILNEARIIAVPSTPPR